MGDNDITIKIKSDKVKEKTCLWQYTARVLEKNDIYNSFRQQYLLLEWIKSNNEKCIKNDYILEGETIQIPASKSDILRIVCSQLKMLHNIPGYLENIKKQEENIIIIGTNQHRGGTTRDKIVDFAIDTLFYERDVNKYSKMMFVHQALREVRLNTDKKWTILLCTQKYTAKQIKKIKAAFYDEEEMKNCVANVIDIGIWELSKIINYINFGDINGNTKSMKRKCIKVAHLSVYSHGIVGAFLFWMYDLLPGRYFDKDWASKFKKEAFTSDAKIYSYACRTGLGNKNFDLAKGNLDLMEDKSLAQALVDATGATVYAYYRRTSYEDTLLTKNERDKIEAYAKFSKEEKKSVKLTDEETKLYEIWCTNKYFVDSDILYPKGALNPVRADSTPIGLATSMVTFKSKKK